MAQRGQRFELDLDQADFTANLLPNEAPSDKKQPDVVKDLVERIPSSVPKPPTFKATRSGFPEHKRISAFKRRRELGSDNQDLNKANPEPSRIPATQIPPSDRAIINHVGNKYGYDFESQQKAEISEDNKRRIADMSTEDIEEARAELMSNLNPAFIERLLRRANIDDEQQIQRGGRTYESEDPKEAPDPARVDSHIEEILAEQNMDESRDLPPVSSPQSTEATSSVHFPVPPRSPSSFVPLDPSSPSFLSDLHTHYFPETPHNASSLAWLQDPTPAENAESLYNPEKDSYPTSALRFSFVGKLIPPQESLQIDVSKGLHHHGLAASSAGYTIPELAILSRSTLANQRCIAFQLLGRILFRLGHGDFGPRGSELQEGLWSLIEHERVVEILMKNANSTGGHLSAKTYAVEALWLWRKGGGSDRGLLKDGQKIAK